MNRSPIQTIKKWVEPFHVDVQTKSNQEINECFEEEKYLLYELDTEIKKEETFDTYWEEFKETYFLAKTSRFLELTIEVFLQGYVDFMYICEEEDTPRALLFVKRAFLNDFDVIEEKELMEEINRSDVDLDQVYWDAFSFRLMRIKIVEEADKVVVKTTKGPIILPEDIYAICYQSYIGTISFVYHVQKIIEFLKKQDFLIHRIEGPIDMVKVEKGHMDIKDAIDVGLYTRRRYFLMGEEDTHYLFGFLENDEQCSELGFLMEWEILKNKRSCWR